MFREGREGLLPPTANWTGDFLQTRPEQMRGDSTLGWAWGSRQEALVSGADSGGLRTSQLTFLGLSLYLGIQRLIFRREGSVKILPSNVYPKRLVNHRKNTDTHQAL